MLGVGETKGHSEEDDVKRDFNDINRMVKIMHLPLGWKEKVLSLHMEKEI